MVCIDFNTAQPEILIAILSVFPFEGYQEFENNIHAYISNDDWVDVQDDVMTTIKGLGILRKIEQLPEKNWNAEWEASFNPVTIVDFCAIRASFHQPIGTCTHEIVIDPKMAFGTGHHESTELIIRQMRNIDFVGKTVLDLGCGTGILAILAAMLGATDVTAVDNDPEAVDSARENATINAVKINCTYGTITDLASDAFDIVLANINRNTLVTIMPELKRVLRRDGILLLSGILIIDKDGMDHVARNENLILKNEQTLGEWLSILVMDDR
jgi:ribosomal protein L11 methyltransferase